MSEIDPMPPPMPTTSSPDRIQRNSGALWGGGILILIGLYFLLANLGLLDWLKWDYVWPIVLIAIGLWLVIRRIR